MGFQNGGIGAVLWVCQRRGPPAWQDRGSVTVRMLCLMLVGLAGWMVLLARSAASKDAALLVPRQVLD